jgi:hypothetical protein
VVGTTLLHVPRDMCFGSIFLGDRGAWLTVQYLTAHGMLPTINFGYFYGLLPIFLGRFWFGLFGLTPIAFELASLVCAIAVALAAARFARALSLNPVGIGILVVALPIAIPSAYFSLALGVEAVLLSHALAAFAENRRSHALALATAACLAKPEMGYFFGLMILIAIAVAATHRTRDGSREFDWNMAIRQSIPAAIVGLMLAIVLGFEFGLQALITSIIPAGGIRDYHALGFGLFNRGGYDFYSLHGAPLVGYFATVIPFWFLGGIWLAISGVSAARRLIRHEVSGDLDRRLKETIVFCAAAQLVAALVMFGGPASWMNYSFALVMGLAACAVSDDFNFAPIAILAIMAFLSDYGITCAAIHEWRKSSYSPRYAYAWLSSSDRADLQSIENLTSGHRRIVISIMNGADTVWPGMMPAPTAYLLPGNDIGHESDRTIDAINHAEFVIVPVKKNPADARRMLPWLDHAVDRLPVVWKSKDQGLEVRRNPHPLPPPN